MARMCPIRTTPKPVRRASVRARVPSERLGAEQQARRSTRSASTPAGREKARMGSAAANATMPSQKGESVSWRTSQPLPICCIQVPTFDTRLPSQRARKSGTASAPIRANRPAPAASPASAASSGTAPVAVASSGGIAAAARSRIRPRMPMSPPRPASLCVVRETARGRLGAPRTARATAWLWSTDVGIAGDWIRGAGRSSGRDEERGRGNIKGAVSPRIVWVPLDSGTIPPARRSGARNVCRGAATPIVAAHILLP
jgi:hypothetical protein